MVKGPVFCGWGPSNPPSTMQSVFTWTSGLRIPWAADISSLESPESSSPLVNPSSALLQDMLKEHRESRGSKSSMSETCDEPVRNTPERSQSEQDTTAEKMRKFNSALSAGLKQPREMGMREMDHVGCIQYVFMAMEIDLSAVHFKNQ